MCPIGSALVVCRVEYAGHRYSYTTEFVYYVVVAMAPLLWQPRSPVSRSMVAAGAAA